MNNKKQFETYLYSTVGAAVMVVIVIALNVIIRPVVKRIDLTKDKLYTLSEGTRRILGRIDTPVQIRFYFSQSDPATPVEYKTYAARVEDLLNEYKLHAKGNGVGAIMNMETAFHLSESAGGTNMKWEADVHILGPVASMGQRVLQPIVNQQVSHVLNSLDEQVQEASAS